MNRVHELTAHALDQLQKPDFNWRAPDHRDPLHVNDVGPRNKESKKEGDHVDAAFQQHQHSPDLVIAYAKLGHEIEQAWSIPYAFPCEVTGVLIGADRP